MRDTQEQQVWGDNWVTQKVGVNRIIMLIAAVFWLVFAFFGGEMLADITLFEEPHSLLTLVKGFIYFILIVAVTDLSGNLKPVFVRGGEPQPKAPLILNLLTVIVVLLGHAYVLR